MRTKLRGKAKQRQRAAAPVPARQRGARTMADHPCPITTPHHAVLEYGGRHNTIGVRCTATGAFWDLTQIYRHKQTGLPLDAPLSEEERLSWSRRLFASAGCMDPESADL